MVDNDLVLKMQMNCGKFRVEQLDQIESGALNFKFAKTIVFVSREVIDKNPVFIWVM